jgi:hypothetical protein
VNDRFEICHHAIMSGTSNTRPAGRRIIAAKEPYVGHDFERGLNHSGRQHMDPLEGALELIGAFATIGVVLFLFVRRQAPQTDFNDQDVASVAADRLFIPTKDF